MKYMKMPEIGSGSGFLLGQQSADYFNFLCGDCGKKITSIMVDDVDAAVGFVFTAKCEECKKEWRRLKIDALWGESMKPYIEARVKEIWAR